jgi:hypothetical protein
MIVDWRRDVKRCENVSGSFWHGARDSWAKTRRLRRVWLFLHNLRVSEPKAVSRIYFSTFAETTTTRPLSPMVVLPTTTLSPCLRLIGD